MRLLTLIFVGLLCVPAAARDAHAGAAVAGSYLNRHNAEQAMAEIGDRFSSVEAEQILVVPGVVSGTTYYRVVVVPAAGHSGRDVVAGLHRSGFEGAWYLADYVPPAAPAQPVRVASPSAPQRNTTSELEATPVSVEDVVSLMPAIERANAGAGDVELIETLSGIPRHRIEVANFREADLEFILDGRVDEAVWQSLPYYDEFMVAVPAKGTPGEYETRMRLFATERGLYVSAVLLQPPETRVSRLSVRDDFIDRDSFGFIVDATGEGQVGYWFICALGGSVQDGKLLPERNYQRDWDGPWQSKTVELDDGWSVEMFLPWSMMSMSETEGERTIGFVASRQVSHRNERYQWPGHPYSSARFLSALNEIQVDGVQPVAQRAVIPFAAATMDEANDEDDLRVGLDLAWKPSPMLEITGTLNPDFGAVEADDVVLNLTAFETFFPEKRLFFLEGNEVFDANPRAGISNIMRITTNEDFASTSRRVYPYEFIPSPISLLNTRRIGGTANQVSLEPGVTPLRGQRDVPTDLLGAMKLTGTIGDTRYGLMGAFEDDVEWRGADDLGNPVNIDDSGRDFAVARFLYEDIGATRRSVGYLGTMVSGPLYDAFAHSIDAHYTSASGRMRADGQLIMSERDGVEGYGGLFDMMYAVSGNLRHKFELDFMDENVDLNDLGFLSRNNYAKARYVLLYNQQNFTDSIKNFRTTLVAEQQYNIDPGQVSDSGLYWRTSMVLPGRNTLKTSLGYLPERWEDRDSRGNGAYEVEDRGWVDVLLATNAQDMFSFSASIGALQEHLGDWTLQGSAGVTIRPSDQFMIDLDLRYKRRRGWLVYQGGRNFGRYNGSEIQPSLEFNWFLAYNHQIKLSLQWAGIKANEDGFYVIPAGDGPLQPAARTMADHDFTVSLLTAQLRYRWEIAPLTDFFLVYNRGNSLPNQYSSGFEDLFSDSFNDPIIDSLVAKIRWRFGN